MRIKRLLFLITLPVMLFSCNDDNGGYTQVKTIEHLIYLNVEEYREDNSLSGPFVEQYLIVKEAQLYSYKMANGIEEVGTQGLNEHYSTLNEKIGIYNFHALALQTDTNDEDQIFTELLQIPGADSTLLADVTQCGVGVEADGNGLIYVTVILAKAD